MSQKNFFYDLNAGVKAFRQIFLICLFDANSRYKRTFLGPFWPILAVSFGSLGIAMLWGIIFKMDLRVAIPQITIGFIIWYYLAATVVEGASCFVDQKTTFLSQKLPLSFFPLMTLTKNTVVFFKSLTVVLVILLVFPPEKYTNLLYFPICFLISFINLFFMVYFIGFFSTRYRDLAVLIQSLMPILFFLSPVVFKVEYLGEGMEWVMLINPLSVILISIREPLLGHYPEPFYVYVQLIMLAFFFFAVLLLFAKKHKNLPFWL